MNDDEQLAGSYRAWADAKASDPPSFESLAPQYSPRRRINRTMFLVAINVLSLAVIVFVISNVVERTRLERARHEVDANHTAWEVTMPWPAETDFLLNWPDELASTYVLPSFQTQTNQPNKPQNN
ncbi:MAG: hypothetical protein AAF585_04395 [Verrucomicrobiota bacterium]